MPYSPLVSKIRVHNPNRKGSSSANRNYVIYIATREGVSLEDINGINDLLHRKGMMEKDLKEDVLHHEANNSEYLEYIARRPRSHGLFGNIDTSDIKAVSSDIGSLTRSGKVIYRGIISLSEKDADALGFRNINAWNNYLTKVMPDIAKELGVSSYDHTWIAAFHAEETHPHVHYMLWDNRDKVKSPYIHTVTQQKIRIYLENEMFDDSYERAIKMTFKEELKELNKSRNLERTRILDETEAIMKDAGYVPGVEYEKLPTRCTNEYLAKIASETNILISELPGHGSFKYDYLPTAAKEQVNKIVGLILEKTDIRSSYETYLNNVKRGLQLQGKTKTKIKAEIKKAEKDLQKRIANRVLKELRGSLLDIKYPENIHEDKLVYEGYNMYEKFTSPQNEHYFMEWNDTYKKAMGLLYGEKKVDVEKAFEILENQAISGNALAIFETGKLIDRELIPNIDIKEANEFYDEAKVAFEKIYDTSDDKYKKQYSAYRIGKYFSAAIGSIEEADYDKAKLWLQRAADNKYAQYTLGKLYLADKTFVSDKKDSLENKIKARELFEESAKGKKGNPYAAYELGKVYQLGIGTEIDNVKAQLHYRTAFNKFLQMSEESTDDTLFYRLGRMYTDGLGTEVNLNEGEKFINKAAELGNETAKLHLATLYINKDDMIFQKKGIQLLEDMSNENHSMAQYKLGAIYADQERPELYDIEKAIGYLEKAAAQENQFGQYKLGSIYANPERPELYNIEKAIGYLEVSAEQGNQFAQYKLGATYADPELPELYNIGKAIGYLETSAEQGNQFAQYKLGSIYADQERPELYDIEKAIGYLEKAAAQENQFGQYKLGAIYANPERPELYNIEKAIEYLEVSAERGNQFAQYKLGATYADPELPELYNIGKAIGYLEASAEQSNQFAQYKLGAIYADPELPELYNLEKAMGYLEASAEQGNQFAQYKLGVIYADKDCLMYYNPEKAVEYLKASAEQGNQFAQCKLGAMYYYGKDIPKDSELGKYWLECSASQGNQIAQSILDGKGIDFSYCLLKGVLSSLENFNRQAKQNYNEIARTHSKQAAREKYLHRDK